LPSYSVDGRTLTLSSVERVLYPAAGFTKGDLIAYYVSVADVLLPHIAGRPLTLGRWPAGVEARGFAQMECRGAPEWMKTRPLKLRTGEIRNYCVIDDRASLVWAANLSTIELHPYYASGPDEEQTLVAIFDLDPQPGAGLPEAAEAALRLRELLAARGLEAVVKTSGGDGIHIFVPLNVAHEYALVRSFCEEVAAELHAPRINVDCAQNHPRRSLAAPYSLRAADIPVASAPLRWEELERGERLVITAAEMRARIEDCGDLFRPLLELQQRLPS
jgi:bifunctional non-homologous end joining protein LigD